MISATIDARNMLSNLTSSFSKTSFRLPREQYSVIMQMFGDSVHAPINAQMLSCRRSFSCERGRVIKDTSL